MSNDPKDPKSTPMSASDEDIDSILEETRFLSDQENMAKEAARLSGGPKMEEIYSNTSKEVRLRNQSPLEVETEDGPEVTAPEETTETPTPESDIQEEEETVVTLTPEYDEGTTISEDIIDEVDSFVETPPIVVKDCDGIDIDIDEEDSTEETQESGEEDKSADSDTAEEGDEDDGLSNFERLFGKPKPVGAVQTVVSKVPVYQHESRVEKVHVRAGKFSAVVENEYKKYIASPNPVISQNLKPDKDGVQEEGEEKPSAKNIAKGLMGRIVSFFSSSEDDTAEEFKEKTIQIEDFRSHQDAKAIMNEVNSNIRKMFVNSIFTGGLFLLTLTLTIVTRIIAEKLAANYLASILLTIVSLLTLLIACWVNRVTITGGLSVLKKFKGNSDTGAAVAAACAVIQGIVAVIIPTEFFSGGQFLYSSVAIFALLLNTLGKLFMVLRVKDNFKFVVNKTTSTYAAKIYTNEDVAQQLVSGTTQDKPIVAYQHETDFMSDFLRLSYSPDPSEDMASKIAPVTLLCSLFVAILYGIVAKDVWGAFSALAVMACVSVPVCDLLAVNLPLRLLCKDTLSKNAMISGYPAVRQFCDTKAVICQARDLYPEDSITLNGVKAFTNVKIEEGMLAAAAVLKEAQSPMASVFNHVAQSSGGTLPKVESVLYEDGLGLVGWVGGERILVGCRGLLEKYAVQTPSEDFEEKQKIDGRQVTYLARSGELLAMFVTTYATTLRIAQQLQKAEENGISLLVRTTDCNVTGEKIADDFGIFFRSVKVLPTGLGNVCKEITSAKEDTSRAYLATRGAFIPLLRSISGCVRLKSNISLAVIIQLIGVVLGVLLMASVALFAGVGALKNLEILLFMVFWAVAAIVVPALQKP